MRLGCLKLDVIYPHGYYYYYEKTKNKDGKIVKVLITHPNDKSYKSYLNSLK